MSGDPREPAPPSADFAVSVIVPVYRAERYVRQAVDSALAALDRAGIEGEVVLIDDASPDASGRICRELAAAHERVRVLTHAGGANRGAGASRNFGVAEARCPWVAFLDADDLYEPTRFLRTAREAARPGVEGVYEATRVLREGEARGGGGLAGGVLMPVRRIAPERLFDRLVFVTLGTFHTAGVTLRRELVQRAGGFPESLPLSQDAALWVAAAALGRLVPGDRKRAVARYRRHAGNRSFRDRRTMAEAGLERWRHLHRWSRGRGLAPRERGLLRARVATSAFECRCLRRGGAAARLGPLAERVVRYLPKSLLSRWGRRMEHRDRDAPPPPAPR